MDGKLFAAMVTPLNEDETIDIAGLETLVERMLNGGIQGVFAGGTIGEGPALRDMQRFVLFRETVRCVRSRVPVLANVSDTGTMRSLDQVKSAVEAGVDALVVTPRFAFPPRTEGETFRHVQAVAHASDVPLWFYENPTTTGVTSRFEHLSQILGLDNVQGLKYSGSDRSLFTRCVNEFQPEVPVMTGNVGDIAFAASLGAGAISGIGSLLPRLCVRTFDAARCGDTKKAGALQQAIESVYSIYGGKGMPFWPTAQKYVLKKLGVLKSCTTTAPFLQIGPEQEALIDEALKKIDPKYFEL